MIKPIILGTVIVLLAGCSNQNKPRTVNDSEKPAGVVKIMSDKDIDTFADLRTVSSYQGNNRLRRFYTINNYTKHSKILKNPDIYIFSSRAINVVNCDTNERAVFERVYFSQSYAQGEVVAKTDQIGQWQSFDKRSMMALIAGMICQIDPERLKAEPPKETRTPLINL